MMPGAYYNEHDGFAAAFVTAAMFGMEVA